MYAFARFGLVTLALTGLLAVGWLALSDSPGDAAESARSVTDRADASVPLPASRVEPAPMVALADRIPQEVRNQADVRRVVRVCRNAEPSDAASLRALAVGSPDPLIAGNAIRALGRLGEFTGDAAYRQLVDDPRLRVRQEAIIALGHSCDRGAIGVLQTVLDERDPRFRPLAIQALGATGGKRARAALEEILRDPRASIVDRTFARAGLDGVKQRDAP